MMNNGNISISESGKCLSIFRLLRFLPFFLFLIIFHHCFGQEISSKIDKKDLKSFIKTLTSSQFSGRGLDNDGQIKTQEFITSRFKELQLEPFSADGYLEKFSLYQISRGELFINTQNHRKLQNFDRMIFGGVIQYNEEIKREVIFGGYGTEEELNQIEVENRFVLISLKDEREETNIKRRLEARNASGLIIFQKDDRNFETMKRRLKEFHTQKRYSIANRLDTVKLDSLFEEIFNTITTINTITIPEAEVKNVIGLSKNKLVNLADNRKIDDVPPVVINIHFERVGKMVETANVAGIIRGESDKTIIISAHYDHLGKNDKLYYPGADDNASGVAALLELAEEFSQYINLKYTMIFLATSAEEGGLLGSLYHTEHPDFDHSKFICNINIDMISRCDNIHNDCKYLYCIGNNQSEMLDSIVRKANKLYPQYIFDYSENGSDIFARTDGHSFMKKGIPSITFFSGLHNDYHKPTDTMDKINFDILENRIKLICEVIKLLQKDSVP
jgi:hypothetical protein